MVELVGPAAMAWAAAHARALRALRLNHQFPPWSDPADTAIALAKGGQLRLDPGTGLLAGREWVRARADHALAPTVLGELADVRLDDLPPVEAERLLGKRAYLEALRIVEPPAARRTAVVLRNLNAGRASYRITVDRVDVATGGLSRYTLIAEDEPGERITAGELSLSAHGHFEDILAVLSTQDAALAFAVLRSKGMDVQEIVHGSIGPAVAPASLAIDALAAATGFPPDLTGLVLSAKLERVSVELRGGRVDDPIPGAITVPVAAADFGLVVLRKWAAPVADVARLQAFLADRGSRNLVYGYEPLP